MPTGRVKWFNAQKGFGFIEQEGGEESHVPLFSARGFLFLVSTFRHHTSQSRTSNGEPTARSRQYFRNFSKIAGLGNRSSMLGELRYSSRGTLTIGQLPERTRTILPGRMPSMIRSVSKRI